MTEVSAKIGRDKDTAPTKVSYPLLDATSLNELKANFTEKVAVAHCKGSITVALQSLIRSLLKANKSPAEIQKAVNEWKPGMRTPGKSKLEKAEDIIGKMSAEERKALLAKIRQG